MKCIYYKMLVDLWANIRQFERNIHVQRWILVVQNYKICKLQFDLYFWSNKHFEIESKRIQFIFGSVGLYRLSAYMFTHANQKELTQRIECVVEFWELYAHTATCRTMTNSKRLCVCCDSHMQYHLKLYRQFLFHIFFTNQIFSFSINCILLLQEILVMKFWKLSILIYYYENLCVFEWNKNMWNLYGDPMHWLKINK